MVFEVRGPARPSWSHLCTSIISNQDGSVNSGHKQTDVIIMDLAKALDKVPHMWLLHKLDYCGIRGSNHKWINSWLSGRTQQQGWQKGGQYSLTVVLIGLYWSIEVVDWGRLNHRHANVYASVL